MMKNECKVLHLVDNLPLIKQIKSDGASASSSASTHFCLEQFSFMKQGLPGLTHPVKISFKATHKLDSHGKELPPSVSLLERTHH